MPGISRKYLHRPLTDAEVPIGGVTGGPDLDMWMGAGCCEFHRHSLLSAMTVDLPRN